MLTNVDYRSEFGKVIKMVRGNKMVSKEHYLIA